MSMRALTAVLVTLLALGTMSCASLPKRGFLTRYFSGSYLQNSLRTTHDLAGTPFHSAIDSYTVPARSYPPSERPSTAFLQTRSVCLAVARQRAGDAAFQGFGDQSQKSVFDRAYSECVAWRANH